MKITDKYVFFWGTNDVFSQWHPSKFTDENGINYNCAEQYMMYQKAIMFNDDETALQIMLTDSPREQKQFGRKVSNFVPNVWDCYKYHIVCKGTYFKFSTPDFIKYAYEYPDKTFVEASPYDKVWGVGLRDSDHRIIDPTNWQGSNLLGRAITETFQMIRWEKGSINND